MNKYCYKCKHRYTNHWTKQPTLMCTHPSLLRSVWDASPMEFTKVVREDKNRCGLEGKWYEKG